MSSPTDHNESHGPDGLDDWLSTPVEPLLPRPGTYEAIVRRARRRRLNRALTATAAAAAVIAAVAFVPKVTGLLTAQRVHVPSAVTPTRSPQSPPSPVTSSSPTAPQATGTAGRLAAPGFTPASVTFVGLKTGWALGRSAAPCPENGCTALARTDDTGQHWYSVRAPAAGAPEGDRGVSQVRFLNGADGWVFGPELWATHDGAQTWNRISTGGQRVISLETTGDRVFAIFARCPGTGAGWNTGCSSYQLYSAAASGGAWTPVPGGSGPGTASLVLTGRTGYLLAQNGESVTVLSGPVSGGAPWKAAAAVPCGQPPGTPTSTPTPQPAAGTGGTAGVKPAALLAAASSSNLFLLCTAGAGTGAQAKTVYLSTDGGQQWRRRGSASATGTATSVAAAEGTLLIATGSGIYVSRDDGATWQMSLQVPGGGVGYVGMTDALQGFAVPVGQEAVWFTADGGQSWHQSAI